MALRQTLPVVADNVLQRSLDPVWGYRLEFGLIQEWGYSMAENDEFARDGTVLGGAILDRILADDIGSA